jgi:Uma2 family endonuclease
VRLTYDDYVLFPDDGLRHELIDGEHYVSPTPIRKHQGISGDLFGLIWSYLRQHPIGRVYAAPFDVIFSQFDVAQPDIVYLSHDRMATIEVDPWVKGAPNLVVEISSPSTRKRDETIKRRLYEQFGVDQYWIVDPESGTVRVLRRIEARLDLVETLSRANGQLLTTPLLPGLELPLATIFQD